MGTLARLPADLHLPRRPLPDSAMPPEYLDNLQCHLRACHDAIRGQEADPCDRRAPLSLKPGDPLLVAVSPLHYKHKLAPKWEGPY